MERTYYVYWYFDPRAGVPIYIGKGYGNRCRHHLMPRSLWGKPWPFYQRLREMVITGVIPSVKPLKEGMTEDEAYAEEVRLILFYGREDLGTGSLLNQSVGGAGNPGFTYTAEMREERSRRQKGRKGKDHTPRSRELISQALTGREIGQITRDRLSESLKNYERTPEHAAAIANGHKKSVESFDLETGVTIKSYGGIQDTTADGCTPSAISRVCNGKGKSHKGLGWRYSGNQSRGATLSPETLAKMSAAKDKAKKPVDAYDLETGVVVKSYESMAAVVADGYQRGNVYSACTGKYRSHKGLGWRYSTTHELN